MEKQLNGFPQLAGPDAVKGYAGLSGAALVYSTRTLDAIDAAGEIS